LGFELLGDRVICVDFCIDRVSVGVIVGKGCIYAVEGEMGILAGDFFGALTEFVPGGNAMDGDTSARDTGSAVTDVRGASEEGVEVGAHGEFVVQILAVILTRWLLNQGLVTFLQAFQDFKDDRYACK
jgi:hypothetical protein